MPPLPKHEITLLEGVQGCFPGKFLAALAGKVRLALAAKFPIIPKGYSGSVYPLVGTPS